MSLDDADVSKHLRGEFLDTPWNVDGFRPRQLGAGGMGRSDSGSVRKGGASSGKKGKKGGDRRSNNGKMSSSKKKDHESYEMSMSMSFFFYF